jgi:glycerophosphoryl diester phosphodiesterase
VTRRALTIVAHRGAPTQAVENTLRSVQIADALGADAIEFDVRATRDGVPVLLHDSTLERFWGLKQPVAGTDLATVRGLTASAPDGGVDRIATVEEVLDGTSRSTLLFDCKVPSSIVAIRNMIESRMQWERVVFIGEPEILEVVRAAIPEARIVMSWSNPQMPPPQLLDRIKPFAVNIEWNDANGAGAPAIRSKGYDVWCYTVDDVSTARRALDARINGIITNDYKLLDSALRP